ncbi:MAG: hypothetical protein EON54_15045, partial [Alcaligenaceae bacterium]
MQSIRKTTSLRKWFFFRLSYIAAGDEQSNNDSFRFGCAIVTLHQPKKLWSVSMALKRIAALTLLLTSAAFAAPTIALAQDKQT